MISVKIIVGLILATLVIQTIDAAKNIVCYYGTWATYRNGAGKFSVENINPFLCTHLIYSFVGIRSNGTIRILDPWLDLEDNWGLGTMKQFNVLKTVNPSLKTLVAVGGWNEGSQTFSTVAQNSILRTRFAKDAAAFCMKYGFDGLDVDWEYPGQRDGDPTVDRQNFVSLLADLRAEFSKHSLLLTAAVAAAESSASISYNIPEISRYLDFINLMTYDLHGPWESKTGHNAPLYVGANDLTPTQKQLNVNSSVSYWLQSGAPASKINLGVAFYGRSFTLRSPDEHGVGAPTNGPGQGGPYTYESGFLGYNEICGKLSVDKWNQCWDASQKVPFAYGGNQWVGYDNEESLSLKCDFINKNGLGGGMIWSIETDDFLGTCGEKFILLKTLNRKLQSNGAITTTTTSSGSSSTTTSKWSSSTTQTTKTPVGSPTTTTSKWPSSTTQTTKAPGGSSTTTLRSTTTVSGTFKCVSTGYFRDPKDCGKFYYCDKTTRFEFVCPSGLYFDETTLVCNWAIAVNCK